MEGTQVITSMLANRPSRASVKSSYQKKKPAEAKLPRANALEEDSDPDTFPEEKDPFYDENLDEEDQTWVDDRRPKGISSDAVLNCPACFAPLSQDCQRSEVFSNQYRAIFVSNVVVNKDEETRPVQGDDDPEMKYWNVHCELCSCHVAVMDSDEVYHFFHVLADPGHSAVHSRKARKAQAHLTEDPQRAQNQLRRQKRETGSISVRKRPLPPLQHR